MLTLGSHFDGIAGFPLAAAGNGIEVVWATEIEPFPIVVSKAHFPHMKHYGSIKDVSGAELEPVDIITFGSPCQDLSIAGKRAGLEGERSGLFMEAVRTIREMRGATSGVYPRIAVWENVPGAMSSNNGADFRAVLEEILEAEVPVPRSGKWASAGMVRGNGREIAWRILDAQYWGVPQRRRRIFLVADFRGQCAAEILFECQGLPGHIAESGKAREEAAAGAGDGVAIPINTQIATRHNKLGRGTGFGVGDDGDPAYTLQHAHSHAVCAPREGVKGTSRVYYESGPGWVSEGVGCLRAEGENRPSRPTHTVLEPVTLDGNDKARCLAARGDSSPCIDRGQNVVLAPQLYDMTHADEVIRPVEPGKCPTLNARMGTGGNQVPVLMEPASRVGYLVRRLTPTECERLQGFPDNWTDVHDMQLTGRKMCLSSDTARYKALGNSVAIPCVRWIMRRIKEQLENMGG
jgi:DNA (cytosine-5)-methyltransferase 1